jgi:hypothetical protein
MTFGSEIAAARARMAAGELEAAMGHLERAHVIGQRQVWPHVLSHWLMLKLELRRGRPGAAFGQLLRIVLGALGSAVGVVPTGNTGGSDIGMFRRLPLPPDLQAAIDAEPADTLAGVAPLAWVVLALMAFAMAWRPGLHLLLLPGAQLAGWSMLLGALALAILLSSPRLLPRRRVLAGKLLSIGLLAAAIVFATSGAMAAGFGILATRIFFAASKN